MSWLDELKVFGTVQIYDFISCFWEKQITNLYRLYYCIRSSYCKICWLFSKLFESLFSRKQKIESKIWDDLYKRFPVTILFRPFQNFINMLADDLDKAGSMDSLQSNDMYLVQLKINIFDSAKFWDYPIKIHLYSQ